MNTNAIINNQLLNNIGNSTTETKEARALDVNIIRTRDIRRNKRENMDWFSI